MEGGVAHGTQHFGYSQPRCMSAHGCAWGMEQMTHLLSVWGPDKCGIGSCCNELGWDNWLALLTADRFVSMSDELINSPLYSPSTRPFHH